MRLVLLLAFFILLSCVPSIGRDTVISPEDISESENQELDQPSISVEDEGPSTNTVVSISASELMISEVLYDAISDEQDGNTFIELYGTPNASIDGYSIEIIDGSSKKVMKKINFSQNDLLSSEGLFVLCDLKTGSKSESNISPCDKIENFDLQNGPDALRLVSQAGHMSDSLCYGFSDELLDESICPYKSTPDVAGGQSLFRVNYMISFNNTVDFQVSKNPTPGRSGGDLLAEPSLDSSENQNNNQTLSSDKIDSESLPDELPSSKNLSPYYSQIRITEVITDPQHDWNDSSGGNGVPFDAFFGDGTIGSNDEWVELKNISSDVINLKDWMLNFVDGTDEYFLFSEEDASILFSNGGSVSEFESQEMLVVTDIPGDMKNKIELILLDDQQLVVDDVFIEDGNAISAEDESVVFDLDKNVSKSAATILF